MELFTSLLPEDVIVDEGTPQGTRALRHYLDYAKKGVLHEAVDHGREPDSDFEVAVATVLRERGFDVQPQLGVAGYFIDIAVRNPERPGSFLAAIECDGATYHSSGSARDRDRIRQEILESLGWRDRIYRVWSTDWFSDPHRETAKLIQFVESRRQVVHAQDEDLRECPAFDMAEEQQPAQSIVTDSGTRATTPLSSDASDSFVEVGDKVTFFYLDATSDRRSFTIVEYDSDERHGWLNENTPLAKALLGLAPGEEGTLQLEAGAKRGFRVTKLERGAQMRAG